MAIEPYSNESQTKWDRGEFQVMIQSPRSSNPIGFCDGDKSDEQQIHQRANREGVEVTIEKKVLKTGREVWTVLPV